MQGRGLMKHDAFRSVFGAVLFVLPLIAQEPWRDKPWRNWTIEDVRKILTHSPWVQSTYIPYQPQRSGEDLEITPPPILDVRVGSFPGEVLNPAESHPVLRPDQTFFIRWESAKTIRRALFRECELRNPCPNSMKAEELDAISTEYLITIVSDPLNQLPPAYESRLKENSALRFHRSGSQERPVRVVVRYRERASNPDAYEFYFSRTLATGKDVIVSQEDQIDFLAQVGPRIFRARFNPPKMRTPQGPDF